LFGHLNTIALIFRESPNQNAGNLYRQQHAAPSKKLLLEF
jgi:hypothetical protein